MPENLLRTRPAKESRAARSIVVGLIVAESLLGGFSLSSVISPPLMAQASTQPPPAKSEIREGWRKSMVRVRLPKKGCFTATYPSLQWREVACVAPPPPNVRFTVGSTSGDYAALRPLPLTGLINSATGSFPIVTGVNKESDSISSVANAYTLQLNTNNFFTTTSVDPVCPTANPQCRGLQQFIFENTNGNAFMEYFLSIPGASSCPTGWTQVSSIFPGYISCTVFSPAVHFGSQPITNLQSLTLTGTATAGGNDTAFVGMGGMMSAVNTDSILNVASGWVDAEFNVFGACCGSQAIFNNGSTINVKTTIHYGGTAAPSCFMISYTTETNNLSLVGAPVFGTQPSPAIEFTESNKPGGAPACAAAAGIGDTHLTTFGGLLYDFQAAGDFLLAESGKDFLVENRQVSGAPTWPNATINKAVATQMGQARVAVCTGPSRLVVDGKVTQMGEGQKLSLPGGVGILHIGDVYLVQDDNGNSMRAEDNGTYINLTVGLGRWPTAVHGVLANANGKVNQIEARTGAVLTAPFQLNQLYHQFADSWRVPERESLLAPCGERVDTGVPQKPFYASDLPPEIRRRAQTVCTQAGVKGKALLEACTIDVAFTGHETAAKVYVGMRAPAAVGRIVTLRSKGDGDGDRDDKYDKDKDKD
jgi:hypothetical protein